MRDYDLLDYEDEIVKILEDYGFDDIIVGDTIIFHILGLSVEWRDISDIDDCIVEGEFDYTYTVWAIKQAFEYAYDAMADIQALIFGD